MHLFLRFLTDTRATRNWKGRALVPLFLASVVSSTTSNAAPIIDQTGNLLLNGSRQGERVLTGLRSLAKSSGAISNVRGMGSLVAFTLDSAEARDLADLPRQIEVTI